MPGIYPTDEIPFSLPVHNDLPKHKRPTFYTRFFTAAEEIEMDKPIEASIEAEREGDREAAVTHVAKVINKRITRFENLPFEELTPRNLLDHFQYDDIFSLIPAAEEAVRVRRSQLKKSESPSNSNSNGSADPASETTAASESA